jgi:hypothetical protein
MMIKEENTNAKVKKFNKYVDAPACTFEANANDFKLV